MIMYVYIDIDIYIAVAFYSGSAQTSPSFALPGHSVGQQSPAILLRQITADLGYLPLQQCGAYDLQGKMMAGRNGGWTRV